MSEAVIKVGNISRQYRLGNVGLGIIGADLNRWYQTKLEKKMTALKKVKVTIYGGDINF